MQKDSGSGYQKFDIQDSPWTLTKKYPGDKKECIKKSFTGLVQQNYKDHSCGKFFLDVGKFEFSNEY